MMKGYSLTILLFCLVSWSVFGQGNVSFDDGRLKATSEVETMSDKKNDRFYDYYAFSLKNESNQTIRCNVQITYSLKGQEKKADLSEEIVLKPGEVINGDRNTRRDLTLFKNYNIGNSGKKLSDKNITLVSFKVNYL